MPNLSQQYPVQYAEWVAAGGIEANFRLHLLGIGAIPATAKDVLDLARTALAQAKGVLDNLSTQS